MQTAKLCLAAACLLGVASARLSAQGFDGVMQFVSSEHGDKPDTITQMTKGSKMRFEGMGRGGGAMIMDGNSRLILMPEQKQYMIIPIAPDNTPVKQKKQGTAVKTGKTETVAGIRCEVWHYTGVKNDGTPQDGDACLAKGAGLMIGRLAVGRMAMYFTEGGQAFSQALASGMGIMKVTSNGKTDLVAIKAQVTSVPDAMFSPPSDYTKMDRAHMGGPPHTP